MSELGTFICALGRKALGAGNFSALLPEVLPQIATAFGADFAACYVSRDGAHQEHRWERVLRVPRGRRFSAVPWLRDRSPATGSQRRLIHHDEPDGRRLARAGFSQAVLAGVALDRPQGLHLVLAREQGHKWDEEDARDLEAVATMLGLAASRGELQQAALYDPATGLYNRRYLDAVLPGELERAQRFRMALTLLIIDVDRFKTINDRFGHLAGDRVLAGVARVLTDSVRSCDMVMRYGGDEFVVILPATTLVGTRQVADRIRARVRSLKLGSGDSQIPLTVSGGAAAASARTTPRSLLHTADTRLYEGKTAGRDRIVFPRHRVHELSPQLNLLDTQSWRHLRSMSLADNSMSLADKKTRS